MTSSVNQSPKGKQLIEMFAHNRKINPSCFEFYPTKYDEKLAYANNACNVANSLFLGGDPEESRGAMQYGNAQYKELIKYSNLRNQELDKFEEVTGIVRIRECRWEFSRS